MRSLSSTSHFGFERAWVSKAVKNIKKTPDLFTAGERSNRFKGIKAIGVGSIKVESLKNWLLAMKIIKQGYKSTHELTKAGEIILEFDPTIETNGTWAFIHYNLSSNLEIWNWYMNVFEPSKYNSELLKKELKTYYDDSSDATVKNGLQSLTTAMRQTKLGSDFGYFIENDSVFYKKEPPEEMLSPLIFAYAVLDWMKRNHRIDVHTSELFKPGAPARIFNISGDRVSKYLSFIRDNYGKKVLWLSRTAGLNSLSVNTQLNPLVLLTCYYQKEVEGIDTPEDMEEAIDYYNDNFLRNEDELPLEGF